MTPQATERPLVSAINLPLLFTILLVVDSLHFIFARALLPYLPPEMSSLLLLGVAAVEVGIYQAARRRLQPDAFRHHWRFFAIIGLLVAASTLINYSAVAYIDPGTAALLGKAGVLFSMALGLIWLRERLRPAELLGALLALAGVFLITFQPGDYLRIGSLLVLASALFYALHTAIVKRHGEGMDFGNFFFFRIVATTFFLFLFVIGRGQWTWPGGAAWLIVLVAATVDVVISRSLYYLSLRRMPMTIHTIILTLSPVVTILWSLALFDEEPTPRSLAGGALVILGVVLVSLQRRQVSQ